MNTHQPEKMRVLESVRKTGQSSICDLQLQQEHWPVVARCFFTLLFVFLFVSSVQAACLTSGCHDQMGKKQFVHAPVAEEDCLACHQQGDADHPSASGAEFTLSSAGSSLCFGCHDDASFTGPYKHGPASSGACSTCHDPHASENVFLLKRPVQEMCLSCHTDFARSMKEAAFVHSAIRELDCASCHLSHSSEKPMLLKGDSVELCFDCHENLKSKYESSLTKHKALYIEKRCGNCHLAHFSKHPILLIKEGKELCYTCHGEDDSSGSDGLANMRKEIEGKKVVHGPVADGQCVDCHDTHGSSYAKILIGAFPQSFYAPYRPGDYDFCFECHEEKLLTAQSTESHTGFRNGTENLHYRHVAREQKGRACKTCHSVHASDGQKLINPDGIAFGNWKIPIRFETTEAGGGCMPGCHRAMKYDRIEPVDNAAPPEDPNKERKIDYTPLAQ